MRRKFAIGFVLGVAVAAGIMWVQSALNANAASPELAEETEVASIQAENSDVVEETASTNVEKQVTAEIETAASETKDGVPDAVAVR